jgi:preprotein translocase subunit SecG
MEITTMGATLIGVLAALAAVMALIAWGMIAWLGLTQALAIMFIFTCILMMLVILIQKPKGGGLSGAFGGAGGGQQAAFGAKTGDVLTVVTVCLFVVFLGLAMGLTWSTHADMDALALDEDQATQALEDAIPPVTIPENMPANAPESTDVPNVPASTDAPDTSESQP